MAGRESGRHVVVGRGGAAYRAFVPHPLPPQVRYDGRLIALLSEADRAVGELNGLGQMLPNPDLLIGPFVHREAVLSSRIEGTLATARDVYIHEAGQAASGRGTPTDVGEVANYVEALEYGLARLETLPLNLRLLCELHERLMTGVRGGEAHPGAFRTFQNWIGRPGSRIADAEYVPPPPAELTEVLGRLERYIDAADPADPPLVRLALVHVQFEMIHPFLDGNGRIGRLLVSLLLVHWGLLDMPLLYLSAYFERRRAEYYARLLATSRDAAWEEWVAFFLDGVRTESRDAAQRARDLQDLRSAWRDRLTGARASALTVRLVDALFEQPILTIPRAQAILGVTYPTAKVHMEKLVRAAILAPHGPQSYARGYAAEEVLRIIGT